MTVRLALIVEGHAEIASVPALVHRIARQLGLPPPVLVRPYRVRRDRVFDEAELSRALVYARRQTQGKGAVLVILGADGDCPAEAGPRLLERVRRLQPDLPAAVVLARVEYEAWLIRGRGRSADFKGFRAGSRRRTIRRA